MVTKAYEVLVTVSSDVDNEQVAIAEASRYLAYADQTDAFGYHAEVFDVDTYEGRDSGGWVIGLNFVTNLAGDDDIKRFMDEMAMLSRVTTVEEVAFKPQ